jgi:hypothetical protein
MGRTTCSHTHLFGFDLSPLHLKEIWILLDCKFKPFSSFFLLLAKILKTQKRNFKNKKWKWSDFGSFQCQKWGGKSKIHYILILGF